MDENRLMELWALTMLSQLAASGSAGPEFVRVRITTGTHAGDLANLLRIDPDGVHHVPLDLGCLHTYTADSIEYITPETVETEESGEDDGHQFSSVTLAVLEKMLNEIRMVVELKDAGAEIEYRIPDLDQSLPDLEVLHTFVQAEIRTYGSR